MSNSSGEGSGTALTTHVVAEHFANHLHFLYHYHGWYPLSLRITGFDEETDLYATQHG